MIPVIKDYDACQTIIKVILMYIIATCEHYGIIEVSM